MFTKQTCECLLYRLVDVAAAADAGLAVGGDAAVTLVTLVKMLAMQDVGARPPLVVPHWGVVVTHAAGSKHQATL
jgi:hypothetical protein